MNTTRQTELEGRLASLRGTWQPEDFSARLLVTEDRVAIASDVHIPYHDEALLAKLLTEAANEGVQAIVWLGDLLDLPTFSSWGRTDYSTSFSRELGIARGVIEMAAEVVPVQYWSLGNHEARWMRKLDHQVYMEQLAMAAGLTTLLEDGRLIVSDNPTLDAFDGAWMLTHPAVYGRQPLAMPSKLATRYQQHVMSAHAHHWGQGVDETNTWTVVETGGLFKPEYHQYIQHRVTNHRAWTQGFWLLLNGVPVGYRGGRP